MNNRHKKKKGMTLIEVIISVTLLSLLIIPVSGLIMNSLKNNKKAEIKQKSAYVGQKLLEEIKAYSGIEVDSNNFKLLDGDLLQKDVTTGVFSALVTRTVDGEVSGNKFNVQLTIEKNNNFDYEGSDNVSENSDADFIFKFSNNPSTNIELVDVGSVPKPLSSSELILKINESMSIKVYDKSTSALILSGNKSNTIKNKILLQLDSSFSNENIKLDIENNTNKNVDIYIVKNNSRQKINLTSIKGDITYYQGLLETGASKDSDLYKVNVVVKDERSGEELFKGESTANLNLK